MSTGKTGQRVLQLVDLHGDVMGTLPINDGQTAAAYDQLALQAADEYGVPTDLATASPRASTGQTPGSAGRYGWLGGAQRSSEALGGVMLMGARLYQPSTGRFLSVDPSPGGNSTAYDYCSGDPVNCSDLDGNWGLPKCLKKALQVVAKVAEVASYIPGPIGASAAAVSMVAYAATGNRDKAFEMGVTVAAALIGAGAAAHAVIRATSIAGKAGKATREFKSTAALGRAVHAKFEAKVVRAGGKPGRLIEGNGLRGKPDGFRAGDVPIELKPHNRAALRKGEKQLRRYEKITGNQGELWSYRQTPVLKRIKYQRIR